MAEVMNNTEPDANMDEAETIKINAKEPTNQNNSILDFDNDPEKAVNQAINGDIPIVMFSLTYCLFCKLTKRRLRKYMDIEDTSLIRIIEINKLSSKSAAAVKNRLNSITGGSSTPRLFIAGEFIGGNNQSKKLDSEGKLEGIIHNAISHKPK